MMSAIDQLRIVASKAEGEEPLAVAVRQRHSALISLELEEVEIFTLLTCWQVMMTLLGQSMENEELKMPVGDLPSAKFYDRFGQDLSSVMGKLPIM